MKQSRSTLVFLRNCTDGKDRITIVEIAREKGVRKDPGENHMPRLLIIEDDRNYRENLTLLLELEGYQVWQAESGATGMREARRIEPDIILSDLMLGDMDGLEVARMLKGDPATAVIPIIVISGRGDESAEIVQALEFAEEYIRKPCRTEEVKARVRSMLRLKRIQDELRDLTRSLEARVQEQTITLRDSNRQLQSEIELRRRREGEVQTLNERLLHTREDERGKLAVQLHDDLGQQLMALKWIVQDAFQSAECPRSELILDRIGGLTATTRMLAHDLSPAQHHSLGLSGAIRELITALPAHIQINADIEALDGFFEDDWNLDVYRIIQEAIQNVIKHAGANRIELSCRREGPELTIAIVDDGKGLNPGPSGPGLGMRIMNQRARTLGGELSIESRPGRTCLSFSVTRKVMEAAV